jgi:hypothetical protein
MSTPDLDKAMYDLIRGLKRQLEDEEKEKVRLSNPTLLEDLVALHRKTANAEARKIVVQILEYAGASWAQKVRFQEHISKSTGKPRLYRGQPVLQEVSVPRKHVQNAPKSKRIYRGQVVEA